MDIRVGELNNEDVISLLQEHHSDMLLHSPPESVHALNVEALAAPDVTFWSLWNGEELAGCAALKELSKTHGEIKSMRTSSRYLRKGVAKKLLEHIIEQATLRSYSKLSLETGSLDAFLAAKRLYKSFGFEECAPFAEYVEDPYSTFMTRNMGTSASSAV
jgi:putative acetyltransferase